MKVKLAVLAGCMAIALSCDIALADPHRSIGFSFRDAPIAQQNALLDQKLAQQTNQFIEEAPTEPASQPDSQPASQSASQSASQPASQPVNQSDKQTVRQSNKQIDSQLDEQISFPTSVRKALNFSTFSERQSAPRPDPYRIILETQNRHRRSAQDLSTKERIQQFRNRLPQQIEQVRSEVNQIPGKIQDSTSKAKSSFLVSVETASENNIWQAKLTTFVATIGDRFYQIKESIKELAINTLEQASRQIHQAAQNLKYQNLKQ